jgi:hypothetical protein
MNLIVHSPGAKDLKRLVAELAILVKGGEFHKFLWHFQPDKITPRPIGSLGVVAIGSNFHKNDLGRFSELSQQFKNGIWH